MNDNILPKLSSSPGLPVGSVWCLTGNQHDIHMDITRVFDLLPYYKSRFAPKDDALAGKEDGKWVKYSIDICDKYCDQINGIFIANTM